MVAKVGCVIEAVPSDVIGFVRANLFVEPNGSVHITSTQEMIMSKHHPYQRIGYTFPQTLLPHEAIQVRQLAAKMPFPSMLPCT